MADPLSKLVVYGSPGKYIQGAGALAHLGACVAQLGGRDGTCILLDAGVQFLRNELETSLQAKDVPYLIKVFGGDVRFKVADRIASEASSTGTGAVVVGVGGGKTLDMSKMVRHRVGGANVIVPTIAATDAPTSHSAVAMDDQDQVSVEHYRSNPDLVLVDSEVIVRAPVRYFVSGIGDAISKKYEVRAAHAVGETNFFGGRSAFFVDPLLNICYQALLDHGYEAMCSVKRHQANESVETTIAATVLLSGLLFENGGLVGAHSIANVLVNAGYGVQNLHGELVAAGLMLQLILEDQPTAEREELERFYARVGLPLCLSDLGIDTGNAETVGHLSEQIKARLAKHDFHRSDAIISEAIRMLEVLKSERHSRVE